MYILLGSFYFPYVVLSRIDGCGLLRPKSDIFLQVRLTTACSLSSQVVAGRVMDLATPIRLRLSGRHHDGKCPEGMGAGLVREGQQSIAYRLNTYKISMLYQKYERPQVAI